jgi:hypothetical protein
VSQENPEHNPLARPKRKKHPNKTSEYTVLRLPEDGGIFAVVRKAREHERYTLEPTDREREEGTKIPYYDRVIYLVTPFQNHLDGSPGPSCNCPHWMTKRTGCVHIQKFFEVYPELDPLKQDPSTNPGDHPVEKTQDS